MTGNLALPEGALPNNPCVKMLVSSQKSCHSCGLRRNAPALRQ